MMLSNQEEDDQGKLINQEKGNHYSLSNQKNEIQEEVFQPDTLELVACSICQIRESNSSSLETHMITNHCPDIAAQCFYVTKDSSMLTTLVST